MIHKIFYFCLPFLIPFVLGNRNFVLRNATFFVVGRVVTPGGYFWGVASFGTALSPSRSEMIGTWFSRLSGGGESVVGIRWLETRIDSHPIVTASRGRLASCVGGSRYFRSTYHINHWRETHRRRSGTALDMMVSLKGPCSMIPDERER